MLSGVAIIIASASPALATILHPGDRISVTVYNHPELSPTAPVQLDSQGQVSLPLAGLVSGYDATPSMLSQRIRAKLLAYVRKPAVDVQLVSQGQNIFISGGPGGVLPFTPGETLGAALAQIEGTPPSGDPSQTSARDLLYGSVDLHNVVIERDGRFLPAIDGTSLFVSGKPGIALLPDDTIELHMKPLVVPVAGEVRQPGIAHLDESEPLADALNQVGGPKDESSSVEVILTRQGQEHVITTSSPEYREPAEVGDKLYVPHADRIGVLGSVAKPGSVLLQGDDSLLSAIYYAGGPTKYGDIRNVSVVHNGRKANYDITKLTHGASDQNPQLSDGDTVFVPEGHRIDFSILFQGIVAASALRFL